MTNLVTLYPKLKNWHSCVDSHFVNIITRLSDSALYPSGRLFICYSVDLGLLENAQKLFVAFFLGLSSILT